jgi:tight adherence protein B
MTRALGRTVLALALTGTAVWGQAVPAAATAAPEPTARIVGVGVDGRDMTLVFQAEGFPEGTVVDRDSVAVQIEGTAVESVAEPYTSGDNSISRTAVLAIDNSQSMADGRLDQAKAAARAFVDEVPADVAVGLVTFASGKTLVLEPTMNRADVNAAIDSIELDTAFGTALFDGVAEASDATGDEGARGVIALTDGDESGASTMTLTEAARHANDDGVQVDAVYIGDDAQAPPELQGLVAAAEGDIVTSDPAELETVFRKYAEDIASQVLITAQLPEGVSPPGTVVVAANVGDVPVSDSAFVPGPGKATQPKPVVDYGPQAVPASATSTLLPESALPVILGAIFLALIAVLYVALSGLGRDDKQGRVRRRLSFYTLAGRSQPKADHHSATALGASQVARSAVELASKVVQKRDFEASLGLRLEAAGVPLRAAEWMLIHVGVATGAALMALLVSGGKVLPTALGLALGLGLPFGYLIMKESRRTAAFLAQLPDTLQLLAGSLSAGYSMPQAMDAVVREGAQPITGEFNRALVEARLGVPIEDAMDGIAERMKSRDFAWVVMAIRIQREVGGNLAELLTTVAGTLRERERLRRQVKVLSAEGRLSAWILGLLPLVFALYLVLAQPSYLEPLVTEPMGWALVILGVVLLAVGSFWLRKTVRVEV